MKISHRIAAMFGNDGSITKIGDMTIATIMEAFAEDIEQNWNAEMTRFTFDDGSAIITQGDSWEFSLCRYT